MPGVTTRRGRSPSTGRIRIIGGEWRRRSLSFPAVDNVRPTPDRVRETLFNWLSPTLAGSRCLDLFAGSGALGLEALSRGAGHTTFVDRSSELMASLRHNLNTLGATNADVVESDALAFLDESIGPAVDIVFVDAPFRAGLTDPVCKQLASRSWMRDRSYVYLEHEAEAPEPELPRQWHLARRKTAGQVCYSLYAVD
mgnify:CR=1 FL=1